MARTATLRELLFPARDASYAGLIRALSEPESGPHADNLITNEDLAKSS